MALAMACVGLGGCSGSSEGADTQDAVSETTEGLSNWNIPKISGEFCWGIPNGKECEGYYLVNSSTYKFTQDYFGVCPARGVRINIEVKYWGGDLPAWYKLWR